MKIGRNVKKKRARLLTADCFLRPRRVWYFSTSSTYFRYFKQPQAAAAQMATRVFPSAFEKMKTTRGEL